MGVDADAPRKTVRTLPQLPDDVSWAAVDGIPVGTHILYVRQDGNTKTTLTNRSDAPIDWDICFYGDEAVIRLDGVERRAVLSRLNGMSVSSIRATVAGGQTKVAEYP
jgi:hypothetical protein